MKPLELTGLNGSHPLGFLAACGVLRCCSVEGKHDATLEWKQSDDGSGWMAVLAGIDGLALESLIETLIRRLAKQANRNALGWSDKIDERVRFKQLGMNVIEGASGPDCDETIAWLPALSSDIVLNKGQLRPTSLDLTSASQGFLKSIRGLSTELSKTTKRKGQPAVSVASGAFREALFGPWRYSDETHSLGWDPQTQRLHALRNKLPAKDKKKRSVRGALFLASESLPLFPCFAARGKLRTTGFLRLHGEDWFAWPIWCEPISVNTLQSLLAQPLEHNLKRRGVKVAYRCLRAHTGGSDSNYRVFGNAEEHPLDRQAKA